MRELIREYLKAVCAGRSMLWFYLAALAVLGLSFRISLPQSDLLLLSILGFSPSSFQLIRFITMLILCVGVFLIALLRIHTSSKTDPRNWILMTGVPEPALLAGECIGVLCATTVFVLLTWTPLSAAAALSGVSLEHLIDQVGVFALLHANLLLLAVFITTLPLIFRLPLLLTMLVAAVLLLTVFIDICCSLGNVYPLLSAVLIVALWIRFAAMRRRMNK